MLSILIPLPPLPMANLPLLTPCSDTMPNYCLHGSGQDLRYSAQEGRSALEIQPGKWTQTESTPMSTIYLMKAFHLESEAALHRRSSAPLPTCKPFLRVCPQPWSLLLHWTQMSCQLCKITHLAHVSPWPLISLAWQDFLMVFLPSLPGSTQVN